MENFANVLRNAPSFVEFLSSGTKQISEYDYINLRNTCISEAFNQYTPKSVSDALSYFRPRQNAFKQIVEECGIRIRWDSEFEDRLRDYIKEEGPNPGIGPLGKTEWYSQKRKELEDIMTREDNDVGC